MTGGMLVGFRSFESPEGDFALGFQGFNRPIP
jgi:hypothetical protein